MTESDTLPVEVELDYLYMQQRRTMAILGMMFALHILYFVRRYREHRR